MYALTSENLTKIGRAWRLFRPSPGPSPSPSLPLQCTRRVKSLAGSQKSLRAGSAVRSAVLVDKTASFFKHMRCQF